MYLDHKDNSFIFMLFVGNRCHKTQRLLDVCRCRFCALLHTALVPKRYDRGALVLDEEHDEEFILFAIRCVLIYHSEAPVEKT